MNSELALTIFRAVLSIATVVVTTLLVPFLKQTVIPWMEEKRVYNICRQFVMAAEKLAESGALPKIDKKGYVISRLADSGIDVTPDIDAMIEGAVEELDIALDKVASATLGALMSYDEETTKESE